MPEGCLLRGRGGSFVSICVLLAVFLALWFRPFPARPPQTRRRSGLPRVPPPLEIPHLIKQGAASQLIVDGKPFLALAGELNNDSSSSLEYMKSVWPKLVQAKLNTVLTPVSWAQIEPQEGKFDFRVLDGVIQRRAGSQPSSRALVVRKLEERPLELSARLGEKGFRALPARSDQIGQNPGAAHAR